MGEAQAFPSPVGDTSQPPGEFTLGSRSGTQPLVTHLSKELLTSSLHSLP